MRTSVVTSSRAVFSSAMRNNTSGGPEGFPAPWPRPGAGAAGAACCAYVSPAPNDNRTTAMVFLIFILPGLGQIVTHHVGVFKERGPGVARAAAHLSVEVKVPSVTHALVAQAVEDYKTDQDRLMDQID